MFCKSRSQAFRLYRRDVVRMMLAYALVLLCSSWLVRHDGHLGKFYLYFWSVLPAVPILGVIARMGRYLRQETDEYQRLLVMQSILVGAAALLGTLVVNDFVRAFAHSEALPPFWSFLVFCGGMGMTQWVQTLQNRTSRDDE